MPNILFFLISLTDSVLYKGGLLNILLPVNDMCLATLNCKLKRLILTAVPSAVVVAWISRTLPYILCSWTVNSHISKGDTTVTVHANSQKVAGRRVLCPWLHRRPRMPSSACLPLFWHSLHLLISYHKMVHYSSINVSYVKVLKVRGRRTPINTHMEMTAK
jgi:hypothetical protein